MYRPNNPPVFPSPPTQLSRLPFLGMSLQDHFAAHAMAAMIGTYPTLFISDSNGDRYPAVAKAAYDMARAMLKEREARNDDD